MSDCPRCDGKGGFLYREGQPEHPILNPWMDCPACTDIDARWQALADAVAEGLPDRADATR